MSRFRILQAYKIGGAEMLDAFLTGREPRQAEEGEEQEDPEETTFGKNTRWIRERLGELRLTLKGFVLGDFEGSLEYQDAQIRLAVAELEQASERAAMLNYAATFAGFDKLYGELTREERDRITEQHRTAARQAHFADRLVEKVSVRGNMLLPSEVLTNMMAIGAFQGLPPPPTS